MLNFQEELLRRMRNDVRWISGAGAPTSGTSGTGVNDCGPGSFYTDLTNSQVYLNTGTKASPTWLNIAGGSGVVASGSVSASSVQLATGTITSANITGTGAGQLGHANGVILVPAAGATIINELISAVLINDFATAAYTGGGNTTINIGGGGAALTGLVSNANFIQSAADKTIEFVPLAATFNTYTLNNSLNLVTASAPTNPGTAAGVFRYVVAYRQIATGL